MEMMVHILGNIFNIMKGFNFSLFYLLYSIKLIKYNNFKIKNTFY